MWQCVAFPYIKAVRKAAKLENKFIFKIDTLDPHGIALKRHLQPIIPPTTLTKG